MTGAPRLRLALLCLLLAGCHRAATIRSAGEVGALAFIADGDTTVIDRYTRTATSLTGELRLFSREPHGPPARAAYSVRYGASGRPERAEISISQISPSGGTNPVAREWAAEFGEDGSVSEIETAGGRRVKVDAGADVQPLFGPSIAMLESIVMAARANGLSRIPVFHLATSGRVDTVTVLWPAPDSVTVTIAGSTAAYRVDGSGRILGGAARAEELETVRLH